MKLENLVKVIPTNTKEGEGGEKAEVKEVIIKTPEGIKACVYPRILDENGNILFDATQYLDVKKRWDEAIKYIKGEVSIPWRVLW
jgi:hypothetical protein